MQTEINTSLLTATFDGKEKYNVFRIDSGNFIAVIDVCSVTLLTGKSLITEFSDLAFLANKIQRNLLGIDDKTEQKPTIQRLQLQNVKIGQKFSFLDCKDKKYYIEGLDGNRAITCNKKVFICIDSNLGIIAYELDKDGKETCNSLQSFIHGRGFNSHLYYEYIYLVE